MRMAAQSFKKPKTSCTDHDCPFHGTLSVRGRVLNGSVVSTDMEKTAIIRRDYLHYIPKFKRYERRRSHIAAHSPPCLKVKVGETVKIAECRPLSKTVSFVIVGRMREE